MIIPTPFSPSSAKMRFLLLIVLAISLAAAVPQSRRGSRRFSIATPGLLPGIREPTSNDETRDEAAETSPAASSQSSRPRGRISPRLRSRPTSQAAPSEEPVKVATPKVKQAPNNSGQGGGRLRLRKPIKKVITTTTTTTTTTPAPVPDQMAEKEMKDAPVEESIKATPEKIAKKEMAKIENKPAPEEVVEEPEAAVSEAPTPPKPKSPLRPPKLRPIPIKIGLRGGAVNAPEKKQTEPEPTPTEESTPVNSGFSHRFASRREKGARIQLRGRGSRGKQPEAQPEEGQTKIPDEPGPRSPRTRGRLPRISPRGRTSQPAQEAAAEQTEDTEPAPAAETPQRRFPNFKKPRRVGGEGRRTEGKSKLKRRKIGPRLFRRPLPSTVKSQKESKDDVEITKNPRDDVEISKDPRDDAEISKDPKEDVGTAKQIKETDSNLPLSPTNSDFVLGEPLPLDTESSTIERLSPSSEAPVDIPPPLRTTIQKPTTPTIQVHLDVEEPVRAITSGRVRISPPSRTPSGSVSPPLRTRQGTLSPRGSSRGYRGSQRSTKVVGTVEDTPADEVRRILSGLGSRRRGLSRVSDVADVRESPVEDSVPLPSVPQVQETLADADYMYDYYDYLLNEGY